MNEQDDELYGVTTIANLRSYAGQEGSATLGIRSEVHISGIRSDFVVHKNGRRWHETKDATDALKAFHLAVKETP